MVFAPACAPSEAGGCSTPGAPKGGTGSARSDTQRAQGFPRARRLRRRREFEALLRAGRRLQQGPLEVRFQHGAQDHARLGVIVGRRVAPRAVARNRYKRVLRESFRRQAAALPAMDVVVRIARPTSEAEIGSVLRNVWERLRREGGS